MNIPIEQKQPAETEIYDVGEEIEFGAWYWVKSITIREDGEKVTRTRMGCVTHLGSNYAKVEGVTPDKQLGNWSVRIHFDCFWERCEPVDDPEEVL